MLEGDWNDVCIALKFVTTLIATRAADQIRYLTSTTRHELGCAFYWLLVSFCRLEETHVSAYGFKGVGAFKVIPASGVSLSFR